MILIGVVIYLIYINEVIEYSRNMITDEENCSYYI